jgi:hypothetical protein
MGLEKILDYLDGKQSFTAKDQITLNRTVLSLDEALAISREGKSPTCFLQTGQTVINHDGAVALCCAVYDPVHFVSDDFLSIDAATLKKRREASKLCTTCMANGIHDYATYHPSELWDLLGTRKQIEAGQRVITTMFSRPHLHLREDSRLDKLRKRISKVIPIRVAS